MKISTNVFLVALAFAACQKGKHSDSISGDDRNWGGWVDTFLRGRFV